MGFFFFPFLLGENSPIDHEYVKMILSLSLSLFHQTLQKKPPIFINHTHKKLILAQKKKEKKKKSSIFFSFFSFFLNGKSNLTCVSTHQTTTHVGGAAIDRFHFRFCFRFRSTTSGGWLYRADHLHRRDVSATHFPAVPLRPCSTPTDTDSALLVCSSAPHSNCYSLRRWLTRIADPEPTPPGPESS